MVNSLEIKMREIKACMRLEKEGLAKAKIAVEASHHQRQHLQHIMSNLPTYLPSVQSQIISQPPAVPVLQERNSSLAGPEYNQMHDKEKKKAGVGVLPAGQFVAPRKYITIQEFSGVSSYLKGRLTTDKVNAALDELATRAEENAAVVYAARKGKTIGAEKKHALWLYHNIASHESLKGKTYWALESDLKSGHALRLDKTGKTTLTLLRHLGRITEVRILVDGAMHVVYALT